MDAPANLRCTQSKEKVFVTFEQILLRLIEQKDVISYEGALWILPRALEWFAPALHILHPLMIWAHSRLNISKITNCQKKLNKTVPSQKSDVRKK